MKEDFKYIGENVRKARLSQNLTLEQLAELVGISESFLGVAERGSSGFSVETIVNIADVLNVSTDFLLMDNYSGKQQPSTKLDTLCTLLRNSSDDEVDFIIEYIKLYKNRVIFKAKE